MVSKSRPARFGIRKSSTRKNRPQELTPYWHDEVQKVIRAEQRKMWESELDDTCFEDVVDAHRSGELRTWFDSEDWFQLEEYKPEAVLHAVTTSASFLFVPEVVNAIKAHRFRVQNAVGRQQWDSTVQFFLDLGEALIGTAWKATPGFPVWFRKCIRLEFEATRRDVLDKTRAYKSLSVTARRQQTLLSYLGCELNARKYELGTPRQSAIAIMAERWGVPPNTVKNWLKPAKGPGYVRVEKQPVVVLRGFGRKMVLDLKKGVPPTRKGRPRKKDSGPSSRG